MVYSGLVENQAGHFGAYFRQGAQHYSQWRQGFNELLCHG
jgi:hypothetical protein